MFGDQKVTEDMGGEAGEEVKRLKNLQHIACHGICRQNITVLNIRGYPHDGGLKDENGCRWWVYVHCTNPVTRNNQPGSCNYDTSWGKIKSQNI